MPVHDPRVGIAILSPGRAIVAFRFATDWGMIDMPDPDGESDQLSGSRTSVPDAGARAGWRGIAPGVLLVVIAGLAYFSLRNLPGSTDGVVGPGSLPRSLSAILFVLGAVVVFEGFVGRRAGVSGDA
jgi:hypothetical protein